MAEIIRTSEGTSGGLVTLIVLVPMIVLRQQAWMFLHAVSTDHWIRNDAQPMKAIVTQVGPKRMLEYRYTANGKDYSGRDSRDWEEEKENLVNVGDQITAQVSVSHPWLVGLPCFAQAAMII